MANIGLVGCFCGTQRQKFSFTCEGRIQNQVCDAVLHLDCFIDELRGPGAARCLFCQWQPTLADLKDGIHLWLITLEIDATLLGGELQTAEESVADGNLAALDDVNRIRQQMDELEFLRDEYNCLKASVM